MSPRLAAAAFLAALPAAWGDEAPPNPPEALEAGAAPAAGEAIPPLPPVPGLEKAGIRTRAKTSSVDREGRLLLEGNVAVTGSDFRVSADRAVVWLGAASEGAPPGEERTYRKAEVFAEGLVTFERGPLTVWAERVYFNAQTMELYAKRAKARFKPPAKGQTGIKEEKTGLPPVSVPVYGFAEEVVHRPGGPWVARNGGVTICSYAHPHIWAGAGRIEIHERKEGERGPRVEAYNVTVYGPASPIPGTSRGTPFFLLPYLRDVENIPLRSASAGSSKKWGWFVLTEWDVLKMADFFGLETEVPFDLDVTASLDWYGDRGFGKGLGVEYGGKTFEGDFLGYHLRDRGVDSGKFVPEARDRYWVRWRHRQQLPWDVRMDVQVSKISDRGFLPEFFEQEAKEGPDQETYVYLRRMGPETSWLGRVRPNWAATLTAKVHVNGFQGETEYLPRAAFYVIGEPVLRSTGLPFVLTSKNEVGLLKLRTGDPDNRFTVTKSGRRVPPKRRRRKVPDGPWTFRADTWNTLELPIQTPYVKFVPFGGLRWTGYTRHVGGHGIDRIAPFLGFRSSAEFARVYPGVESALLDIHGLRHVVIPEVKAMWVPWAEAPPRKLIQHDSVDGFGEFSMISFELRNLFETRRKGRTVPLLSIDLEARTFPNGNRDNGGSTLTFEHDVTWHVSEAVSLKTDGVLWSGNPEGYRNVNAGIDIHPPGKRFHVLVQDRFVRNGPNTILGKLEMGLDENWSLAVEVSVDVSRGRSKRPAARQGETKAGLSLIRDCHDFDLIFYVEQDTGQNAGRAGASFGVSLAPKGIGASMFDRRRGSRF